MTYLAIAVVLGYCYLLFGATALGLHKVRASGRLGYDMVTLTCWPWVVYRIRRSRQGPPNLG